MSRTHEQSLPELRKLKKKLEDDLKRKPNSKILKDDLESVNQWIEAREKEAEEF
jgi:hypothetical protein